MNKIKVRINANIPKQLYDRLEIEEDNSGLSKSSIMIIALKTYFDQQDMLKLARKENRL